MTFHDLLAQAHYQWHSCPLKESPVMPLPLFVPGRMGAGHLQRLRPLVGTSRQVITENAGHSGRMDAPSRADPRPALN